MHPDTPAADTDDDDAEALPSRWAQMAIAVATVIVGTVLMLGGLALCLLP